MVHIAQVKVRPTKCACECPAVTLIDLSAVRRSSPCKAEFVAMLGCWAATGDVLSADPAKCKEVADALFNCMRTTVGPHTTLHPQPTHILFSPSPPNHKDRPSTIISVNSNGKSSRLYLTVLDIRSY